MKKRCIEDYDIDELNEVVDKKLIKKIDKVTSQIYADVQNVVDYVYNFYDELYYKKEIQGVEEKEIRIDFVKLLRLMSTAEKMLKHCVASNINGAKNSYDEFIRFKKEELNYDFGDICENIIKFANKGKTL